MTNDVPDLSVVIVNYNTRDLLRDCLRSLMDQPAAPSLEVIVVDNASRDGSVAMVQEEFPGVLLLAQDRNIWYCGGNNVGIEVASGRYVLLLNPDTVVERGALALMVAFIDAHPDYVGVTAQMRYPGGPIQQTCTQVPGYGYLLLTHTPLKWVFRGWRRLLHEEIGYAGWYRDEDHDVTVIPGSCTLMRREDIYLDSHLMLYFPEDDLARRVPGKRRFLAAAHIVHHEKAATRTWLATQIFFRDMVVYVHKHHGAARAGLLWLLTRPLLWGMGLNRRLRG